jgi:N-acetylglucosaminyl-diphospho-decaprenol L-rhamnosyltransferase
VTHQPLQQTRIGLPATSQSTRAYGRHVSTDQCQAFAPVSQGSTDASHSTNRNPHHATAQQERDAVGSQVTIITVCYNSGAALRDMLLTIPPGVSIVLVDNGSSDLPEVRELAANFNAMLIELEQNVGYGRACNRGAQAATTEYLLFLNPDATLQSDAIGAFIRAATRNPDAVAMNPAILGSRGRRRFKRGSVLLPKDKWLPRGWPTTDCEMPVLTGCALFVRRSIFSEVGGFDPNIFLYHEDDDLSFRLAGRGKLMFVRSSVVHHKVTGSSVLGVEIASLKGWHMGRSRVYAARKYGLPRPFRRPLVQACLQLASPLVWLSRNKRAKQWAFLRGVWSMRKQGTSATC